MKLKLLFIVLAILFQVGAVATIVISKESILQSGKQLTLQTAPIDPRDIFKGDYVKLDYNFSSIPCHKLDSKIKQYGLKKGQKVYLSIMIDEYGLGQADELLITAPDDKVYLAGYVRSHWPYKKYEFNAVTQIDCYQKNHPVNVKFGIEQYYVEQGQGKVLESILGKRDDFQQPMLVKIAVSEKGDAIIHSFDWANIAMKTEILREAQRNAPDNQSNASIRFTMKNTGDKTITLPLKQNNCSFMLVPAANNPQLQKTAKSAFNRKNCQGADTRLKTLNPSETISIDLDLNQSQWLVTYKNQPTALSRLPPGYRYRIIYEGELIKGINANIISSAFHGSGNID